MNNASKKRPALQQLAARSTDKIIKRDPCAWPKVTRGRHAPESTDFKPSIRITATVLNIDRNESFYQISYTDLDGHDRIKLIGRELFRTPAKVVDILVKAHASLSHDSATAIDLVRKALDAKSDRKFCVTGRSGWHDGSIVYPTETFGELADELLHEGASDIDPALGLWKGKLARWRKGLREPCEFSDYLVFSIAVAGAGILLDIIGEDEGALFHLHGAKPKKSSSVGEKAKSSSGKTLAARAAASTDGRCRKSDLATFAITERAVEDFCFAHNHLVVVLDEEGRAGTAGSRVKTAYLPYLIPSGRGTLRSRKATRDPDLQNQQWALFGISTGEDPLDDPANPTGRPEGAQVRMLGVPVPPGGRGGIFNRVKGSPTQVLEKSKRLARQVEETIASNYGVAMPAYLRQLPAIRSTLGNRVRRIIDKFVERAGADTNPWERRFAERFGIVLAAAILLSEFGIGPWTKKRARIAIQRIYKKARAASASVDEAADALISRLQRIIADGKWFPVIQKGDKLSAKKAAKAWGAIKNVPKVGRAILVPYSRLERLVTPSAITGAVLRKLADRGILRRASDGKLARETMIKPLTGSKRRRYVCLSMKALRA